MPNHIKFHLKIKVIPNLSKKLQTDKIHIINSLIRANMSNAQKYIGKIVKIKIDRPIGSKHPKFDFYYPINYGFIENTKAPDREEIDAYLLGVNEPVTFFEGKCIAIIHRLNDDDDKLVVIPESLLDISDDQIHQATNFQEQFFKSKIIRQ